MRTLGFKLSCALTAYTSVPPSHKQEKKEPKIYFRHLKKMTEKWNRKKKGPRWPVLKVGEEGRNGLCTRAENKRPGD